MVSTPQDLKEFYESAYSDEVWTLPELRPHALSTTMYDDVARLLEEEKKGYLLEVGCGAGKLTLALAPQFERAIGSDISETHIALAQQKLEEVRPLLRTKVSFQATDGTDPWPWANDSFDVVLLCAVLEHVVDLFTMMDEAARVCRSGGCLIVSVPNLAYWKHLWALMRGKIPLTGCDTRDVSEWRRIGWDGAHLHYFTKDALNDLLLDAGFEAETWSGDGKWAKLRRWRTNWVGTLTVRARRV